MKENYQPRVLLLHHVFDYGYLISAILPFSDGKVLVGVCYSDVGKRKPDGYIGIINLPPPSPCAEDCNLALSTHLSYHID